MTRSSKHSIFPPIAKKNPTYLKKFDSVRLDNYYWLKDRENPEVLDYLEKENKYYESMTINTKDFQKKIFEEIKNKIKEDDQSVPYFLNGYWYITKFEEKKDYPIYVRKKASLDAIDELLFDCNKLAKGHEYFNLSNIIRTYSNI